MDQPKTSMVNVKPCKVKDKSNGESTNKSMVVELAFDFRLQFTINRKFTTRKEMQQWICGEARKLGFVVVVAKSDNGGNNRKTLVVMCYQRMWQSYGLLQQETEVTTTLKCKCSFRLKSYLLSCGQWSVNVIDETHNHKKAKRFEGHKYVEWLKSKKAGIDV
jgi:hypothetical protein